ncbi:MAG TPA: MBL fold metallo-hydrolase [Streptosporangiaceae bacterium]|jgi:L-ascorbate metabolism protein UlaG (beta-lactamase superfamily)
MRFTKFTHACARIEADGVTLLIDPGAFSEPAALDGANAVLITHEHFDHVEPERLRAAATADPDLLIWTNAAVAEQLAVHPELKDRLRTVAHGDTFTAGPSAGGVDVHVYGERHALLTRAMEPPANIGFHIGGVAFYPGDALTVPEEPVHTLLTPTDAPWLRRVDLDDFVSAVAPKAGVSMHDGLLNDIGIMLVDGAMKAYGTALSADFRRVHVGASTELG